MCHWRSIACLSLTCVYFVACVMTLVAAPLYAAETSTSETREQWVIQLGAFVEPLNDDELNHFRTHGALIHEQRANGLQTISVGPYPSMDAARGDLARVRQTVPDAFIRERTKTGYWTSSDSRAVDTRAGDIRAGARDDTPPVEGQKGSTDGVTEEPIRSRD